MTDIINWITHNQEWFLSGIGTTIFAFLFKKIFSKKDSVPHKKTGIEKVVLAKGDATVSLQNKLTYAETVGKRMSHLREKILQLSLRKMTEFLKLDSVTLLEKFENGEQEYPLSLLKKIEEFFFIRDDYLEKGDGVIFKRFNLSSESVRNYLQMGYTPLLLCCPDERDDLYCYQMFRREVDGYVQNAIADTVGSFASNGGGRINITYLIDALLHLGFDEYYVRIVKIKRDDWQRIQNCNYYNPSFNYGFGDVECQDIFGLWFEESRKSKKPFEKYMISSS